MHNRHKYVLMATTLVIIGALVACNGQSRLDERTTPAIPTASLTTPTQIAVISRTPEAIKTTRATVTALPQASATPFLFPSSFIFPKWLSNSEHTILMMLTNPSDSAYTFTFVNANLQERHDISVPISEASSYFWIAGGKGLAFLPTDRTSVHLVDTTTGQVTNYPVTETGTGCITQYVEHLWANNRPPTSETFSCQPTNGDCCNLESGDGPQYDQDFEEVDNRVVAVSVTNRQTGQTRRIEFADPTEDMYAIVLSSPPSDLSKLAVLQGKLVDPSILDTRWRYSTPGDRVVVFDLATGRQIAAFEGNYATLSWSPDKSQILTQLGSQICVLHVADHISHCSETTDSDLARVSLLRWSANGKQIYFVQNAKRADLCVIDVASDDVFCPTAGLKELDTLNVESYRVSLDEEFFIFSYGSSCADCDYWGEPSSAIIRKDGTDFFLLGEEVYDPQSTFGPYPYGSITMRPNK